jgi:hypothetical protein
LSEDIQTLFPVERNPKILSEVNIFAAILNKKDSELIEKTFKKEKNIFLSMFVNVLSVSSNHSLVINVQTDDFKSIDFLS